MKSNPNIVLEILNHKDEFSEPVWDGYGEKPVSETSIESSVSQVESLGDFNIKEKEKPMRILVFGSTGMLGKEVCRFLGLTHEIVLPKERIDISDRTAVKRFISKKYSFGGIDAVVNCAAITDVAGIETDLDLRKESLSVNCFGTRNVAEACKEFNVRMIHFSTDYVYSEDSPRTGKGGNESPKNVYGLHKLMGDKFVEENLSGTGNYAIVRIGCLYGVHREKSFLHKFLRNVVKESEKTGKSVKAVDVVNSQRSTPTSDRYVAHSLEPFISGKLSGTWSLSSHGSATRYEFSRRFMDYLSEYRYYLEFPKGFFDVSIRPEGKLSEYLPKESVLEELNSERHLEICDSWEAELREFVRENIEMLRSFAIGCADQKETP